ncbi:MAG: gluconokinase [Anaerolineales bacterium]
MGPRGFLIMGVSGSGKTTLGEPLARKLGWDFFDADDFHPPENIAKMAAGIPLNDLDRAPWLAALHDKFLSTLGADRHLVLACSALKETYRAQLLEGMDGIAIIYLKGSYDLIWSRMSIRERHYMKPEMLQSQFDALEEPKDAIVLDAKMSVKDMIDTITKNMEDGY